MALTLYCEMINLARAQERRRHMTAELSKAGISAKFFPAFDYKENGAEAMLEHCRATGPWGPFHTNNMAITISHAQVWERFLETGDDLCLVMEDDVFLSPELSDWLNDLSWWPQNADIVKLERWDSPSLKVLMQQAVGRHKGRSIQRILSRHVGAAGYILTRKAARQFLAQKPFNITIDNLLFNFNASPAARRMQVYQVAPALIVQGNEPPDQAVNTGVRLRPKGLSLISQKLKRAYYEIAYPLPIIFQALTGKAKLAQIPYEPYAESQTSASPKD